MSCTSPMVRIPTYDINPDTGKHRGKLMSWSQFLNYTGGKYRSFYDWKDKYMESHPEQSAYGDPQLIPCSHCASCRLQYSREWANRCMLELENHESAYFVTLTYDNDHMFDKNGDHWTPDMPRQPSLIKDHVSQFMTKLRKMSGQDLRYFAAGEYGEDTNHTGIRRPHYHIIIFGLVIPDLKFYKRSDIGDNYYTSQWLTRCWCDDMRFKPDPYGYVVVADVTWESCAYTARYCMKKRNGDEIWKLYKVMDVNPEFTKMSNHPGIASQYFNRNGPSLLLSDGINISTVKGGRKINVPKYFKRICSRDYSDFTDSLSDLLVRDVEMKERQKLSLVSYDQTDYLHIEAEITERKISQLRRKDL